MSAAEETISKQASENAQPKTAPMINRILDFLSAVRFGVVLLCILVLLSFVGMIIIQQNVNGFDSYFASLTPAEKLVYGSLGLFDIYHSWYYNFLLLVLSLNIVLASIEHFPKSWLYISKPKVSATRGFLLRQKQNTVLTVQGNTKEEIAEKISRVFKANKLTSKIVTGEYNSYAFDEHGNKNYSNIVSKTNIYVFGESGRWNRLGAYIVHVFLLTLFLGHFVALQTGFDADVRMMPGQVTNEIELIKIDLDRQERYAVSLPFTITCTDIEQKLIDSKGAIDIGNTLDWRTQIKIDDPEYGATVADVSLNKPFEYRGYRFFQASAITVGSARRMFLELTPQDGGQPIEVNLMRNGSTDLPDGTRIGYEAFFADFYLNAQGQPDNRSADYNNPAVKINITTPDGERKSAYAFAANISDKIPVGAPVAGYKWRMTNFDKSPLAHVLSIKYDPFNAAFVAWYIGGFGLIGALCFVFFLSHKRVWALIEEKGENDYEIVLGGNTNRSEQAFEDKFKKIVGELGEKKNADGA